MIVYRSPVNTIHRADARQVAAEQEPGSFSLAVLDGPYGMRKAAWDMMKVSGLPEWYAPHLDDVDRLCAASASLYVWNTAEGWATLHPGIVARGWTFRSLVTWNKPDGQALKSGYEGGARCWPDVTEVCGFYQRVGIVQDCGLIAADIRDSDAGRALGVDSRLPALWRGWPHVHGSCWPSKDQFLAYASAAGRHLGGLIWMKRRPPVFKAPIGVSNVWTHGQVGGPERLRGEDGATLHPCQKPITFADRIIRASSRPGERVWVPFGGTCREAVAAEWMARAEPAEARQVVTCEIDDDGRDYLGAVVRQLRGEDVRPRDPRQASLFGAA
jgi:hypothetical protein